MSNYQIYQNYAYLTMDDILLALDQIQIDDKNHNQNLKFPDQNANQNSDPDAKKVVVIIRAPTGS